MYIDLYSKYYMYFKKKSTQAFCDLCLADLHILKNVLISQNNIGPPKTKDFHAYVCTCMCA